METPNPSGGPDTNPIPAPTAQPAPKLSLRPVYTALTLIFGILLGAGGLFAYQEYVAAPIVASYEECTKARGSVIQESYPATCVTRDKKRFTQPLTEEEQKRLEPPESTFPIMTYTCPKTEWVDCMPGPTEGLKFECTSDFLSWAKANCPDFQGAAY